MRVVTPPPASPPNPDGPAAAPQRSVVTFRNRHTCPRETIVTATDHFVDMVYPRQSLAVTKSTHAIAYRQFHLLITITYQWHHIPTTSLTDDISYRPQNLPATKPTEENAYTDNIVRVAPSFVRLARHPTVGVAVFGPKNPRVIEHLM